MADNTKIEWTKHPKTGKGATWNPITGCRLASEGCRNCYAAREAAQGRLKNHASRKGLARINADGVAKFTGEVRFNEQWLDQPLRWKKPRMIFVCAHADLFYEEVPDEWIDQVFAVMALCPQHIFQVLTKRPERMREYLNSIDDNKGGRLEGFRDALVEGMAQKIYAGRTGEDPSMWLAVHSPLPNVWLGVSVEDQATADERIPVLLDTPAALHWLSAEPLLGPIDLTTLTTPNAPRDTLNALTGYAKIYDPDYAGQPDEYAFVDIFGGNRLRWVVVGGESGKHARPMHPDWARDIRDQCEDANVPFLFKQWGEWLPGTFGPAPELRWQGDGPIWDANEFPVDWDDEPKWDDGMSYIDEGEQVFFYKAGKSASGRLLDGLEHDGFPEVK